jgi:hypothetical protein
LEANDRDQECALPILISLDSVAYLFVCYLGESPEVRYIFIIRVPSALGPSIFSSKNVEKSDVKFRISVSIPEERLGKVRFFTKLSITEIGLIGIVNIAVIRIVALLEGNEKH